MSGFIFIYDGRFTNDKFNFLKSNRTFRQGQYKNTNS
jgi:hypothetical protein